MPEWKRVRINFPTTKLRQFIEPVKERVVDKKSDDFNTVYGVTNTEGITITGKLTSEDISEYTAIDKGDFVYNPYRINVGSIGFNSNGLKGCVSPAYIVFRTKNGLNPEFLFTYLKSVFGNHLINWYGNHGGVRNALKYEDLCQIDIPAVNDEIQSQLVDKINLFRPLIKNIDLENNLQLTYAVDLRKQILQEATEGKLTAKWREEHPELINGDNHASKLLEKIKVEKEKLNRKGKITKEKPLPTITEKEKPFNLPNGWAWCRLGDICEYLSTGPFGSMLHKSDYIENGIPVINPTHIVDGEIYSDNKMCVSSETKDRLKRYSLKQGELIIARRGDLSKCAVIENKQDGWLCGTGSFFLKLIGVDNNYFRMAYSSTKSQKYLLQDSIGQTMDNLNQKLLFKLPIAMPPIEEQKVIATQVNKFRLIIDTFERQISERKNICEILMQSVLREAFSESNDQSK